MSKEYKFIQIPTGLPGCEIVRVAERPGSYAGPEVKMSPDEFPIRTDGDWWPIEYCEMSVARLQEAIRIAKQVNEPTTPTTQKDAK